MQSHVGIIDAPEWPTQAANGTASVSEDRGRLIALDYGTPLISSENGVDWAPVGDVPIGSSPPTTACVWPTASGYLQVGGGETMRGFDGATALSVSADGIAWSPVQTFLGFELESDGVAILGDVVVLDGFQSGPDAPAASRAQFMSTDGGASWAPTEGWPSTTIATHDDVVVAVGDGAWVARLSAPL